MKNVILAAATAAAMFAATASNASTFTFGHYSQDNTNTPSLQYVGNTTGTGGTLSSINNPLVDFKFYQDSNSTTILPSVLTHDMLANLTFTATAAGPAWSVLGTNELNFEHGHISITLPASLGIGSGAGTNLISFDFTDLLLSSTGGNAATIQASTTTVNALTNTTSTFTNFTSDFFDFSNIVDKNMALSMTSLIPQLTLLNPTPLTPGCTGNFCIQTGQLRDFQTNSSGDFSTDPAPIYVPEPGMLGLFGAGAFGLAFARRRKK